MPMSHSIEAGLVVIRVSGTVDNEDHRLCFDAMLADPEFHPGMGVLLFDTGGLYAPSSQEAQELVAIVSDFQKNRNMGPFAVVVSGTFHWGVGRMLAAYALIDKTRFRVFRSEAAARAWLSSSGATG